jgi:hypothetical protein
LVEVTTKKIVVIVDIGRSEEEEKEPAPDRRKVD